MHPRLKKIIFDKLYEDLKNVEIIPYKESIWFIDREKQYWYLEYEKSSHLWWRYQFFTIFFLLFSLEQSEYERVIADWVEEVLNSRANTVEYKKYAFPFLVEEVLNSRVKTTGSLFLDDGFQTEEVLNYKVDTTEENWGDLGIKVKEVINSDKIQQNN